jgi:tRNA modification GTPase
MTGQGRGGARKRSGNPQSPIATRPPVDRTLSDRPSPDRPSSPVRRPLPRFGIRHSNFALRHSADTICALATPPGVGSIAVVRVSGARAFTILDRFLPDHPPSRQRSHTVRLSWFTSPAQEPVDQTLVTVFRAPRSYTGEDMAEISCHGGAVAADTILKLLTAAGCRVAGPGEFTRRAVLAGKMTLSQAEAVADMAEARAEPAFRCALDRYRSALSGLVAGVAEDLSELLAEIEYNLGFDDHGASSDAVPRVRIRQIATRLRRTVASAERNCLLNEGATVAIIGRPNAGKSSLFNRLVEAERAITSPVPGTTRDRVEASVVLSGVPVRFVDTSGLTKRAGTRLSRLALAQTGKAVEQADITVALFDSSRPAGSADLAVIAAVRGRKAVCVLNKTDLACRLDRSFFPGCPTRLVPVSCRTGFGIGRLRSRLARALRAGPGPRLAFNRRQLESLRACRDALGRAGSARNLETSALETKSAVDMLNQIDAPAVNTDILDRVFARFCVGK